MIKPLISIIVPIYNVEKYVEKCILSIINQTYKNLQIILVDDGSTDTSGQICDIYAQKDQRIHVIHQKNGGLVRARKAGLDEAKGQYIGFVDGDDYIDKDMYAEMLHDIIKYKVDFLHTGYLKEIDKKTKVELNYNDGIYNIKYLKIQFLQNYILNVNQGYNMSCSIWSKLFKRDLIIKCYNKVPNTQSYGEDLLAVSACVLEGNSIYMKKKAYYHYVYRKKSIVNSSWIASEINLVGLYKSLLELFEHYNCYNNLKDSLEVWFKTSILGNVFSEVRKDEFCIQRYFYPDMLSLKDKKLILYGAGTVGIDFYIQFCKYRCKIVAWVDKYAYNYDFANVIKKDELKNIVYDICIIAVDSCDLAEEIKKELLDINIKENKIIWRQPLRFF